MRSYHQLLPYAFKRFSVLSAARTALPTLAYYATRPALPASDKPALFTMNILPPMLTVWHHCAKKYLGDRVDIVAFDCSGRVDAKRLPGMTVRKFVNLYASVKSDEFIRHIARNRKIAWICDDDMFFISPKAVEYVERELAVPGTASLSLRPRNWWEFRIKKTSVTELPLPPIRGRGWRAAPGEEDLPQEQRLKFRDEYKTYAPSGSYCLALNRDIVWEKERLSLAPEDGNVHAGTRGAVRRYDTFDKANETLLKKGYRCAILSKKEEDECVTGFSGVSGAVMLLNYFKTPESVLDYYSSPEKKLWAGSVLPGTLSAMLAICTVQECHAMITGKPYPLRSLPSRSELENIRRECAPWMRKDFTGFAEMDEASERLKRAL